MALDIETIRQKIAPILRSHDVSKAGIFGSYARGEAKDNSDIDISVEFEKPIGLIEFIAVENQLSELLKNKVDLLTEDSISPYLY